MSTEPGVDHPAVDGEALVSLAERGITVSSRVESVDGVVLSLRPSVGDFVEMKVVEPGNLVDVSWQRPEDQRSVPAEVVEIEQGSLERGGVVRWRLRMTARPTVSQRRNAVRARVTVPVRVGFPPVVGPPPDPVTASEGEPAVLEAEGATIDLSEAGARVTLPAPDAGRPEPGTRLSLAVELEGGNLDATAELIRLVARDQRWILFLGFVDLAERDQDRLRRRVFRALREERARLAG